METLKDVCQAHYLKMGHEVIDAYKHLRLTALSESYFNELTSLILKASPDHGKQVLRALQLRLNGDFRGADLFGTVLPERRTSEDLLQFKQRRFSYLAGKNPRLLELGPWSAWPNERVARFLLAPQSEAGGYSEFIRLDYDDQFAPDLVASCYQIPLAEGSVDHVRSNSLLEHVKDTLNTLKENFRVLAPGGVVEHNMPLHFHLHGYPKDYSRLSPDYFLEILSDIGFREIFVHVRNTSGRIYTSLNMMNSFSTANLSSGERTLLELAKAMLLLLSELDLSDSDMEAVTHSIYVGAVKPGHLEGRSVQRDDAGKLRIDPSTNAVSRISRDIVHPLSKKALRFYGDRFVGTDASFPVKSGVAYLRPEDAQNYTAP